MRKQEYINKLITPHVSGVIVAAEKGQTNYVYDPSPPQSRPVNVYSSAPSITNEELIAALQQCLPDCDIIYQETWVDETPTKKILKKGIVIDWS